MRMGKGFLLAVAACGLAVASSASAEITTDSFGSGVNQFAIQFVSISRATNPTSGCGIVKYDYRMGVFEITNEQRNKFKASVGGTVAGNPAFAYGREPIYTGASVPTNNVSWYEAAQFVNWLNTSTGHEAAYKFTGTQGTTDYKFARWASTDSGYDASNPYRNSNAFYFLPTEHEWVKAAYWNGIALQQYATKAGESLTHGDVTNGTGWNYYSKGYPTNPAGPWAVGSSSEELNGSYDLNTKLHVYRRNGVRGVCRVFATRRDSTRTCGTRCGSPTWSA